MILREVKAGRWHHVEEWLSEGENGSKRLRAKDMRWLGECLGDVLQVPGESPLLWAGYTDDEDKIKKYNSSHYKTLAQVAKTYRAYVVQHLGRDSSQSTRFGKYIADSNADKQCVRNGRSAPLIAKNFWRAISAGFVDAAENPFFIAFNVPVGVCLDKAILCQIELRMLAKGVRRDFVHHFLVNQKNAKCKEIFDSSHKMGISTLAYDCKECTDASMKKCGPAMTYHR